MKDYDRIHEVSLAQHNDNGGNNTLNEHWCWSNEDYDANKNARKTNRRIYSSRQIKNAHG